jgi:hypothetical protein
MALQTARGWLRVGGQGSARGSPEQIAPFHSAALSLVLVHLPAGTSHTTARADELAGAFLRSSTW